jgi:ribosome recycling factor
MPTIGTVRQRMEDSLAAVRRDFATVRTGKASPAILDSVRVDAYGSKLPLNQVASVSTPEASLLVVQPFDRSLIGEIERGIHAAGIGLNPANDGQVVRVPIPALTEERRKEFVKVLKQMGEEARVSVRQARREGNDEVKARQKEGELSEDEARRTIDEIQKLTDQFMQRIDEALAQKEKEVMTV